VSVAGMGHELPPSAVPIIAAAIVDHTGGVKEPG
jgi:hypothetical protein